MHTFGDAALYVRGKKWNTRVPQMLDIAPTLLHLLSVPAPINFGAACYSAENRRLSKTHPQPVSAAILTE
jgi:hypothetical protein